MGKEKDEIFDRLRKLETSGASNDTKVCNILDIVKDFTNAFKQHDEREMAKYEKYDMHVQDLDRTLQDVVSGLKSVQKVHEDQDEKHRLHTDNLAKHEADTAIEFKAINSKLNKGIGAVLAAMSIIGIVAFTYDIMSERQNILEQEKIQLAIEKRKLKEEVSTMKFLMNRNYGKIEGITSTIGGSK